MIVQLASDRQSAFVIRQQDHAEVCGIFAEHFGNHQFRSLKPRDALVYVARHHDDGWESIDSHPQLDPETGFICHYTNTAIKLLLATGNKSPEVNEAYDPYSGIICSMHTYGLYHGRYGLSDTVFLDSVSDEWRNKVKAVLKIELERQERIKADFDERSLVEDDVLFHNYKLLQFFDRLALYVQSMPPEQIEEAQFLNVPRAVGDDVLITANHKDGTIMLSPWVFDVERFEVSTKGRIMQRISDSDTLPEIFEATSISSQTYTFQADF